MRIGIILVVLFSVSACTNHQAVNDRADDVRANISAAKSKNNANEAALTDGIWGLIEIHALDKRIHKPKAIDSFTLKFEDDGNLIASVDCNRGRGSWQAESGHLKISQLATTRAMCFNSIDTRFLDGLNQVRSYHLRDQKLYLGSPEEGSTLVFRQLEAAEENQAQSQSQSTTTPVKPSFNCDLAENTVQKAICNDDSLAALDIQLAGLFGDALNRATDDSKPNVNALQRDWLISRAECGKAENLNRCVTENYRQQITMLQINLAGRKAAETIHYTCTDKAKLTAYFYNDTLIPALVLYRASDQLTLLRAVAASGAKYTGRNLTFWTKGNEALFERDGEDAVNCHIAR